MDYLSFWAAVTALGAPEFWLASIPVLAAAYLILGHALREDPAWKRFGPVFKKFLVIFIPSILAFLGLALLLKASLPLPRPCIVCPADGCSPFCPADSSFPSGHAGSVFAAFSSLYLSVRRKPLLGLFIIPVLVAASRVALGVHTLEDVTGGTLLGLIIPVLVSEIVQKWHKLK